MIDYITKMNLKKYFSHSVALLLVCGAKCDSGYIDQDKEGYYTQNPYELNERTLLKDTMTILPTDVITKLSKKLATNAPKWLITGTEKQPYAIWKEFFAEIPAKIVATLKEKGHNTLPLEDYYGKLGLLFKTATATNEKELIVAAQKLQADANLMQAFEKCIIERHNKPGTIYLNKPTLAYQELLCFILEKTNKLHISLKKLCLNLKKWAENGHPTGWALWNNIQNKHKEQLKCSQLYKYTKNRQVIKESLNLIDQLANAPYSLSYKDFLEILPYGIKQLKDILYEVRLEEDDDIKLLKTYLGIVSSIG